MTSTPLTTRHTPVGSPDLTCVQTDDPVSEVCILIVYSSEAKLSLLDLTSRNRHLRWWINNDY
jgi:hypothetical protein